MLRSGTDFRVLGGEISIFINKKVNLKKYFQACRAVFEPSNDNQDHVDINGACGDRNSDVVQCINNHTDMTPLANAEQCRFHHK